MGIGLKNKLRWGRKLKAIGGFAGENIEIKRGREPEKQRERVIAERRREMVLQWWISDQDDPPPEHHLTLTGIASWSH